MSSPTSLTSSVDKFFELLQVAVGTRQSLSSLPDHSEWKAIHRMASKQSLVGVCFTALQTLGGDADDGFLTIGMSENLYLNWMSYAVAIQLRNETVNARCRQIRQIFADHGARTCIIKGQSNHQYYDDMAMFRQSGDIDIWVEGGRDKVLQLVQDIRPTRSIRETHAQLDIFEDTKVEVHYRPGLIRDFRRNRRLQDFFCSKAEECFSNDSPHLGFTVPTVQFNAVQQLLHIYHHLFDGGIGLRQVMDYYFVLTHLPSSDREATMQVLRRVGVARFTAALMYVEQKVFGLDGRCMLCQPSASDGEYLLSEMLEGGNFGAYDKRKTHDSKKHFYGSFFSTYFANLRHLRFAPMEWLWSPLWRLYYFTWRKMRGYK